MKWAQNWGTVSGGAELYMLNHAEHTHQAIVKNGGDYMPRYRRCRYPGCHAMVQLPDHYCATHHDHEAEYLANRQRWARSHSKQYQRKYNHVTRYRSDIKNEQYSFYRTRTWVTLRQQVLDRDHYVCCYCGQPNSKTVDHIVPIEFDPTRKASIDNLATICRRCHRAKTQWEQSYYGTGQGHHRQDVPEIRDISKISRLMKK